MADMEAVYAPPRDEAKPDPVGAARVLRGRALKLLGVSLVAFVASIGITGVAGGFFGGLAFGASAAIATVGAVFGIASVARGAKHVPALITAGGVALIGSNLFMAGLGALAALMSTWSFSRGRQVRRLGRVLLPPVDRGSAWASEDVGAPVVPEDVRAGLAAQWRENGRTEHASVAAFARLTLDLVALGAPPALVADANRDALDEIRHAEKCFALARALDGRDESPGPFPAAARAPGRSRVRAIALAELAVDSLIDGALNEGVSARIVAKLARRCEDPATAAILREIAPDEGRHSAHGWDVVRWCLEEGGAPVAHALAGAARALPGDMHSTLARDSRSGGWERWGIPGESLEARELLETREHVVRRVEALVARYGVALGRRAA